MSERIPAERFDPREFCRNEMAERGLTERILPGTVRRWLAGERPMSLKVAHALAALFATSPDLWLNLEERSKA